MQAADGVGPAAAAAICGSGDDQDRSNDPWGAASPVATAAAAVTAAINATAAAAIAAACLCDGG